jgi:hypothetical protein
MVAGGKGGTGKSFVAVMLAQYLAHRGSDPLCIDTDPVNATFNSYKALDAHRFEIMNGEDIDPSKFDALFEIVAGSKRVVVVDTGASSFVSLMHYLATTDVPAVLKDMGHDLIIHTVITGGKSLVDTVGGFAILTGLFPDASFVVWVNPFWGPVELNGKKFADSKPYKENKDRILAIVEIPALQAQTFGRDLSNMLQSGLTFDEALKSELPIFTLQRLKMLRDRLFDQFNELEIA